MPRRWKISLLINKLRINYKTKLNLIWKKSKTINKISLLTSSFLSRMKRKELTIMSWWKNWTKLCPIKMNKSLRKYIKCISPIKPSKTKNTLMQKVPRNNNIRVHFLRRKRMLKLSKLNSKRNLVTTLPRRWKNSSLINKLRINYKTKLKLTRIKSMIIRMRSKISSLNWNHL